MNEESAGLERRLRELLATPDDVQQLVDSIRREVADRVVAEAISSHRSSHLGSYEKLGSSGLVSILFLDIVGYSRLKLDDEQREAIELLNRLVLDALAAGGTRLDDVIVLPTGDGMCLCFSSITDGPLMVAEEVQATLVEINRHRRPHMEVRMGIHVGSASRTSDIKGQFNLAGASINIAQRAMSCGDGGHILLTDAAAREMRKLKDYARHLRRIPEAYQVKHGVRLRLYNYVRPGRCGNPDIPDV